MQAGASTGWSATRVTGRRGTDAGKTSTIQWARPQNEMGISVTRSQHVDVDIGMNDFPPSVHPLQNGSVDSLDQKVRPGPYAV